MGQAARRTALRTQTAEFDADGNLTAAISPQTKARTTYTYDADGNMTDPAGSRTATALRTGQRPPAVAGRSVAGPRGAGGPATPAPDTLNACPSDRR
ncbi:RHS repeat protein [Streptomyces sp. JHA26]|uniref:RHS repeat protein n=1 Tax=Streptomyces sp. JHA26 TaxID=1917143 RepID=UPI00098AF81F